MQPFMYLGVEIDFTMGSHYATMPGSFVTRNLKVQLNVSSKIHVYSWYTNEIEKLALASPNCTDETRMHIAKKAVRIAIRRRGKRPKDGVFLSKHKDQI